MIDQKVTIKGATAQAIYNVLMSSAEHTILISDVADVDAKVGGSFSAFGGYATGKNLELIPGELIVQTWRASNWPAGHYSTIRFELSDSPDGAQIHFTQSDLPKGKEKEFESGWDDFYWRPLREYFAA